MAAVGGYTIFGWRGSDGVQLSGMETREVARDGVSGLDVIQIGVRGKPFKMTAMVDCVDALTRAYTKINFSAMQGNLVTVQDNTGINWANILVKDVAHIKEETHTGVVGGLNQGNYWLETQFTLIPMATTYP